MKPRIAHYLFSDLHVFRTENDYLMCGLFARGVEVAKLCKLSNDRKESTMQHLIECPSKPDDSVYNSCDAICRSVVLHNVHVLVRISILVGLSSCCSPPGITRIRLTGKRTEALVKWYGYPTSFNSCIDAKALVRYKG